MNADKIFSHKGGLPRTTAGDQLKKTARKPVGSGSKDS